MKLSLVLAASSCTSLASSSVIDSNAKSSWKRASPQAPNGYAPAEVDCPAVRPKLRQANGLSPEETAWLQKRRPNTVDPMKDFLTRANIAGFDAGGYIDKYKSNVSQIPNIAISFSGGGYRALLNGAGAMAAFDNRTTGSTGQGQLGGLLQSATYVSALSGGGWLTGSIFANNFTTVESIINQGTKSSIWQFQNDLLEGPPKGGIQVLSTADYFSNVVNTVKSKASSTAANFNTSLTDLWGRGLAFQLIDAPDGAPAYTFSSIQNDTLFSAGNSPMPILVSDERAPGDTIISLNATNYEFNPFEMGSFDPTTYGFVPLKFIGSNFSGGEIPQGQGCVAGFDNLGFTMGTSSSLFNQILLNVNSLSIPSIFKGLVTSILTSIDEADNDIADYSPNPFLGFNNKTNGNANSKRLALVDGGEDGQNLPLNPVIQPARNVDVILAIDSSGDTVVTGQPAQNWPNGTSLVATYQRTFGDIMNHTSFPYIPGQDTFVALGMNNRPAFFGCNSTNVTKGNNVPPLVVYIPNSPYDFLSNTSTLNKLSYSISDRNAMVRNGYNVATQANSTRDGASNWPTCVACAVLSRSMERNKVTVPDSCKQCFTQYCWNGTVVPQSQPYIPKPVLVLIKTSSSSMLRPSVLGSALTAAVSGIFLS